MPATPSAAVRLLALASLTLLGALPAAAQEVSIKALCFPRQEDSEPIEMLVGKDKVVKIPLQSQEFTLPVTVPRMPKWRFGCSEVDAEGDFSFTTHAAVTPLSGPKQLLLFIRKGPQNEDGFKIIPLDPARIRGRNYIVLNLTQGPISGLVGGQTFRLAPGRQTVVAPEADRGDNLCFASLNYQRDGKWRPFFSSNWRLRDKSRVLIIAYQASGQRSPRIHSVIDPL